MFDQVSDVPGVSADVFRAVTGLAQDLPSWVRQAAEIGTDAIPVLMAALLAFALWQARRADHRTTAWALLAPVAVVVACAMSIGLKDVLQEHRPCWDLRGVTTIDPCPPYGDWSLPSNHSTFVAAAAVALIFVWRRAVQGVLLVAMALLEGFSRVFVGAHYPHDVAAGLLLGAVVALLVVLALTAPATSLVAQVRDRFVTMRPDRPRGR